MMAVLPKSSTDAMTVEELVNKYFKIPPGKNPTRPRYNTFIRRQIDEMDAMSMIAHVPRVKENERIKRSERYFLKDSSILQYFMSSKVALNVIWSNNVMKTLGPIFGMDETTKTARAARLSQREIALSEKIRLVPDGIARRDARIEPLVLANCISAIENNHMVLLRYENRQQTRTNEIASQTERTILGLVAKEGTIYAITCLGSEDVPVHLPLHRICEVRETGTRAYSRPDFDIDTYIDGQHQLAHILKGEESPIKMVLKVAPEAMFHFRERPIASIFGEQVSEGPTGGDSRWTVSITIPFTVQLPPFIWSHAGWVEVVSPPALRRYVGERLLAAASYYVNDIEPRFGPG